MLYNSYLKDLTREIYQSHRNSYSEAVTAVGMWASMPIPDNRPIQNLLDAFPEAAETVARQLILDVQSKFPETEMDWVPIEYATGYAIYKKHVGEPYFAHFADVYPLTSKLLFPDNLDCQAQMDNWLHYLNTKAF